MRTLARGILISVEGIDGSGKTTLCHTLTETLRTEQFPVMLTKEPGGTALGSHIRAIIQHPAMQLSPIAEYFLFAADRAQHFQEIIIPALKQKNIIISDRLSDSSLVYQGYGRGLDLTMIATVNQWAMQHIKPDLTLYIAVPPDLAYKRLQQRNKPLTAFEQENKAFTERLVHGFETVLHNKAHVIRLDGTQTPEQITQQALNRVTTWLSTLS